MSTTVEEAPASVPPRVALRQAVAVDRLRAVRVGLMLGYLTIYLWWLREKGLPIGRVDVAISLGLFLLCAFVGRSWRTWGVLLLGSLAYCAMWLAYEKTRGAADELGFPLQVESVRNIDRVMFFGHDPAVVLQQRFWNPTTIRWWDVVASTTYMTHFVVPIVVMAVLWATNMRQWARFMKRFATVLAVGCAMFVVLPTAPPWMVSKKYGLIGELDHPITYFGFRHLGFHAFSEGYKVQLSNGNPVAAMPSLHSSFALIVPLFFLPWIKPVWQKAAALAFPVIMLTSLVYFGEHWVIDGLVGWVVTGGSFWFWNRMERRTRRLRTLEARRALPPSLPAEAS